MATCGITSDCAAPTLLVYDATTTKLATQIALPTGTPVATALSRDGRFLYVSTTTAGGGSIVVIDAISHTVRGTYDTGVTGLLAVSRDGSRVFIAPQQGESALYVFNTADHSTASFAAATGSWPEIEASPTLDRLYVSSRNSPTLAAYDTTTGNVVAHRDLAFSQFFGALAVSLDGNRLYAYRQSGTSLNASPFLDLLDPVTLETVASTAAYVNGDIAELPTQQRVYASSPLGWTTRPPAPFTNSSLGITGLQNVAFTPDASHGWASPFHYNEFGVRAYVLTVFDVFADALIATIPLATSWTPVVITPPNVAACSYAVDPTQSSWTTSGGSAIVNLTSGCSWIASSDVAWARLSGMATVSGTGNAALELTVDPNSGSANRTGTLIIGGQVVTVTQAGLASAPPFGSVDSPADNATGIAGELAVTGWALDDVAVTRVQIFRDPAGGETPGQLIYIGDAALVDGARPDVLAFYPSYPNASRAGWGYMLLTNMLPGGGTGSYRLTAIAIDLDGHQNVLGSRTITCNNATSTNPFGTIDTPGQGQTVSGTIVNFGWALTPQPSVVPFDGSTIDVVIDGALAGHPTYGFARADVDATFPGYANTGRAVGYFVLDTTTLANGVHTIAWIVRDNQGGTSGIGSRYFTVRNP